MLPLIPYPHHVHMGDARITVPATVCVTAFPAAAMTLKDYARRTHGLSMTIAADGAVSFAADPTMAPDAYTLVATEGKVTITAATSRGAQNGAVTLIQLMQADGTRFTVPAGHIEDDADSSWRGTMIDLARDWHELHVLFEYVDMCRFYKLRYLHLHFTDDQSYTLPSKAFPNLPSENRHYTEEELKALIAYAKSRDIEIIPEIDVPGHCTSFSRGYADLFGDIGVIRQSEEAMAAMETIFHELCELFSDSFYIHIGGDEARIDAWTKDEPTLAAYRTRGVDVDGMNQNELAQHMYAAFVARMCQTVLSCGKTPVVWEGFSESMNHIIPRETVVMSWENYYQTTDCLQKAGFRIINCSWNPLYIVAPKVHWSRSEIYDWNIYRWRPVHPESPYVGKLLEIQPTEQVEGGQLLAWGDLIEHDYPVVAEGVRAEQAFMEEDCPCLSENLWNCVKISDWDEFSARLQCVDNLYAAFRAGK